MMPHMVYNSHLPYRFEALLWGTGRYAPVGIQTSGLTQPPLLAVAVEKVAQALPPAAARDFVREMLPKIIRFHAWIYRERCPHEAGLAVCLHSWESGMDDTPYWTEPMNHLPKPPVHWRWLREYRPLNPHERASRQEIQKMLALLYIMKRYRFDSAKVIAHTSVAIQDLMFNTILATANESLEHLAESQGEPLPPALHHRFAPTRRALEQLWDHDTQSYYSRDYLTGHLIREPTAATFMPLYAGTTSPARAQALRDQLMGSHGFNTPHPIPSVPTTSRLFEPQRYWRGPVWINLNWFTIVGLERYGFDAEAQWLRARTLGLIEHAGFREYYHPFSGEGLGAHQFSWSAALTLDLLARPPLTSEHD